MSKQSKQGCSGCLFDLVVFAGIAIGGGIYWWSTDNKNFDFSQFLPKNLPIPFTSSPKVSTFPFPTTVPNGTSINLDGSTSMVSINQALKSSFEQKFEQTTVNTKAQGSNIGIQNLLDEKVNLAAISRPLTSEEKQKGLVAVPIAEDKIAVVVGINNPFRRGLTQSQIIKIFSGKITNWSEVGGKNKTIIVINRPNISGTRKMFQRLVLKGVDFGNLNNFKTMNIDATTPILRALDNDGISYATYSQVSEQMTVRTVAIDGLTPEASNYPYKRTLYYTYKQPVTPEVKAFLGYATSDLGKQIISDAQLNKNKKKVAQSVPSKPESSPKNKPNSNQPSTPNKPEKVAALSPWEKKAIRGIYLSRYQVTNNASEAKIRQRVRYYHSQGINTIIHGVWGNGCTMYNSEVMQQTLGYKSCPNEFNGQWLNWLIDEAHQLGMEVHAYFEKGIKIDRNSPIFELANQKKWLVSGIDKTYGGIDHYVLDVDNQEIANFFTDIVVEFVQKYPKIDAVQWDDYLGYHAELPGKVDRTKNLTNFIQKMITATKKANPSVSFDICHHNPYWAKRYFAADWKNWNVDRVFIQAYNEKNFTAELNYAKQYAGIAITDQQLHRLKELANNPQIGSILVFPLSGKPEPTAAKINNLLLSK